MKESRSFELACLKKKKKEEEEEEEETKKKTILAVWSLSGLVLSQWFSAPVGVFFIMKTLEDEWYVVIMAYIS